MDQEDLIIINKFIKEYFMKNEYLDLRKGYIKDDLTIYLSNILREKYYFFNIVEYYIFIQDLKEMIEDEILDVQYEKIRIGFYKRK